MADTMPRQLVDTTGVTVHKDTTDERYRDLRRPRKVRFYVNGDRYFKGKKIFITPHRYFNFNDLLNDLTGKLPSNLNLPYGVRQIFTPRDGRRITDIEDLQDGEAYVCAGFEGFKLIKYGKAELEPWSMARPPQSEENQDYGSEASYGSYRYRGYATNAFHPGRYFRTNGSYPHRKWPGAFGTANSSTYMQSETVPIKPKVITIVRNGNKPRNNVKFLLHRRGVQSFEQLMADISEAFGPKFRNNKVKKLFTTRGREVQSISDFFRDDDVFIGVGNETLSDSDIRDIIEEIYPDSPYAKNLIKDWDKSRKKRDRALPPLNLKDQESDKRDSGFGDSTDSNNETDTISTGRQTFRDPKAGKRGKMGTETMPGKEGYGALRAKARLAHEEREKARRRQQRMADAERRALDEERRRRGLIPLKPIEDPFKKIQEQKEREKEEARIRMAEERKKDEEEREKAKRLAEEQERAEREKKRQQEEEEERQRKEQERLEKERKEQEHKEMVEKAEKAARERQQAAEKVEKEDKEKESAEKENQKAVAPKPSRDRASREAAREGRDERRKRSRQKIVRRSKAERQISGDEVILNKYELGRTLGDGNFAIVRMSRSRATAAEYAMKVIDKPKLKGKEHMVENEIEIMKDCNHVNIVKLYEEYETPDKIYLVMELVKGGDLFDAITQSVKFGEVDSANMVKDLCNALFYLHSRHIVHRDLKPENLLVHRNKDGTITLKLADFGLAMEVKESIFTVCGTPTYVAPEILSEIGYGLEVDMWATGVITYILLCGFPPFRSPDRNQTELFEYIKAGEYEFLSPYWDNISNSAKDLIRRLLVVDKKKRYSAIDVLSHHWIVCNGDTITPRNANKVEEICRDLRKDLEVQARQNLESYNKMKDRRRRDRDTIQQAA